MKNIRKSETDKNRIPVIKRICLAACGVVLLLAGCAGNLHVDESNISEADAPATDIGEAEVSVTDTEEADVLQTENTSNLSDDASDATDTEADNGQEENVEEEDEYEENEEEEDRSFTDGEITIRMVGDILLHTPVEDAARREDGSYNYEHIFENTKELINGADIALVNEEVIIGGADLGVSGYPAFNAPFEIGDELVDTGFDVILHATNHVLDKGKKGLVNCANFWNENYPDIKMLGIHETKEDSEEITIFDIDNISIAILNYTYGTNGISLPDDMPYAVDMLEKDKVIEDLQYANANADFVIVCPHWGTEYRLEPDASQEKWTKIFLENGVDLVLGTHPHVIEPIEMLSDEESGDTMLVYYSLGNYVNWTSGTGDGVANRMVGGMADVTISKKDDEVTIDNYGVIALVTDLEEGTDGVTVYRLSEYSEEQAGDNRITMQDSNFSKEYCDELCNRIWGDLWQ